MGVALSAKRFVLLFLAKQDLLLACHNTMTDVGQSSTTDTNGMHFRHFVGYGKESWHRSERLTFEIEVKTCDYHTYTPGCQLVTDLHDMVVEELRFVDADHFTLLRHKQDACRRIDRRGGNAVAFMTDDLFLAITDIYGRLEYLNLLLGKLSSTKTADELFRLAGEHRAAHDLCDRMFLSWLTDPKENGGGAVIDFGCYGVNLATWLLNGEKPKSVYAVLQQNKPNVYPKVDDDATILLEYDGCTVQVMGSWCWPMNRKDMYVYGSKGYAYQRNGNRMQLLVNDKQGREFNAPRLPAPYDDSYRYLKALVRGQIEEQPSDLSALENNVLVVQILEAAIRSAKTGKAVKL